VLLFCRKEGPSRYYLRIYITLRAQNVSVEEINLDNQFRLNTRQRSFILYAPSAQARKEWMHDINLSINGTHEEEIRVRSEFKAKLQTPEKTVGKETPGKTPGKTGKTPGKETQTTPVQSPVPALKLTEDYYQKDVVKDLTKNIEKTPKEKKQQSSDTSSSSSDSSSDSSESPKKEKERRTSTSNRNRSPKHQVGDLIGNTAEITNINLFTTPTQPRTAAGGFTQSPVNPFLQTPPPNPFSTPISAPPLSPRTPVSGLYSPRGTAVNPFLPSSGQTSSPLPGNTTVNPFL